MTVCRRILPLILTSAFILVSSTAGAKPAGRIVGKVKGKDGTALLGAVVTVFRHDQDGGTINFTRTDKQGIFSLSNITPGSYYLQVTREGFQPATTANVKIDSGRTTAVEVILQQFLDFISADDDPRNWDLKSVIRSTSDRRLIFRDLPGNGTPVFGDTDASFYRSGAIHFASGAAPGTEDFSILPGVAQSGVLSNFAYTEPVSDHGRMIFSGQLNSGYDSFWRVRNTYNYRPSADRDFRLSVGYGRMNLGGPSVEAMRRPAKFFTQDPVFRESAIQSLGLGFEARNRLLDVFDLEYGFDLSRLYYGVTKSFFSPYFQVIFTPAGTWVLKSSLSSRRLTDSNSLLLPNGEVMNLAEPTFISRVNGEVELSQLRHSELSVGKVLPDETAVELAVYGDYLQGPGRPFLVTVSQGGARQTRMQQLREDQSTQHGTRLAINRKILDYLNGSISYVYGTATALSAGNDPGSSDALARDLLKFMRRSYYHSFTSQFDARFPWTKTTVTTIYRWYPGKPLTPIDLFSDKMDISTKGMNFFIRQVIPMPEFMGTTGRWEALVDVRNLFDQGRDRIRASDGDLILTRNPRSLRFGLNLNLY